MFSVYILKSQKDKGFYVGYTSDIERRIREHNNKSTRSTKYKGPWVLAYKEEFSTKAEAWKRERQIKKYKGGEAFKKLVNSGGVA